MSVWLRDRSTLFALGAAQASMLLCGVVLEGCIQNIYDTNTGGQLSVTLTEAKFQDMTLHDRLRNTRRKVIKRTDHTKYATISIAWVTFCIIWFVIISQFMRQADISGHCDKCASYDAFCLPTVPGPPAAPSFTLQDIPIIETSTTSFVLDGATHTSTVVISTPNIVQVPIIIPDIIHVECNACPTTAPNDVCKIDDDGKCAGRSEIPPAVLFIVGSQCLAFALFGVVITIQLMIAPMIHDKKDDSSNSEGAWYSVAMVYAVLSVTAKTTLEIGFLVMLSQMPESAHRA